MLLCDANVLVNAHRQEAPDFERYRDWLEDLVNGGTPFGMSELVLSSFVRIITNARAVRAPARIEDAVQVVDGILERPTCRRIRPGARHFAIFTDLCGQSRAHGNHVADAYHAALAIESGSEWVTDDGGFARFRGLRWRRPLD